MQKFKQFNLKGFPLELYKRIEILAKANRRSVTQEIYAAIEFYLNAQEEINRK